MLSARSEEVDHVRGLEMGADDYVIKPYSIVEFMARVKNQLRRLRAAAIGERLSTKIFYSIQKTIQFFVQVAR